MVIFAHVRCARFSNMEQTDSNMGLGRFYMFATNRYGGLIPSPITLILFVKKIFHVPDSVSDFTIKLT